MTNNMTSVIELATEENTNCHFAGKSLRADTRMKMARTSVTTTAALARDVSSPTQCRARLKRCGMAERSISSPMATNVFVQDALASFAGLDKLFD
jgi:hypothetical protein